MRPRMVGDFLATLAIVERGGSSVRSASFPIEVEDDVDANAPDPEFIGMLEAWRNPKPRANHRRKLKEVVLRLDGKEHDLAIGYVAATPVWRPSYRVVVHEGGEVELQAWGIVQNLSGEDWNDVQLSLVAGAPLAFESTLGDPVTPAAPGRDRHRRGDRRRARGHDLARGEARARSIAWAAWRRRSAGGRAADMARAKATSTYDSKDEEAKPQADERAGVQQSSAQQRRQGLRTPGRGHAPAATAAAPPPAAAQGDEAAVHRRCRERALSAPRRISALAAVAAVDAGTTRYELPGKVTVPDDSATMVLLISQRVTGEAVFLFAPDGGVPDSSLASVPRRALHQRDQLACSSADRSPSSRRARFWAGHARAAAAQGHRHGAVRARAQVGRRERARSRRARRALVQDRGGRVRASSATASTQTIYKIKNGSEQSAKLLVRHPRIRLRGCSSRPPAPKTTRAPATRWCRSWCRPSGPSRAHRRRTPGRAATHRLAVSRWPTKRYKRVPRRPARRSRAGRDAEAAPGRNATP